MNFLIYKKLNKMKIYYLLKKFIIENYILDNLNKIVLYLKWNILIIILKKIFNNLLMNNNLFINMFLIIKYI